VKVIYKTFRILIYLFGVNLISLYVYMGEEEQSQINSNEYVKDIIGEPVINKSDDNNKQRGGSKRRKSRKGRKSRKSRKGRKSRRR